MDRKVGYATRGFPACVDCRWLGATTWLSRRSPCRGHSVLSKSRKDLGRSEGCWYSFVAREFFLMDIWGSGRPELAQTSVFSFAFSVPGLGYPDCVASGIRSVPPTGRHGRAGHAAVPGPRAHGLAPGLQPAIPAPATLGLVSGCCLRAFPLSFRPPNSGRFAWNSPLPTLG